MMRSLAWLLPLMVAMVPVSTVAQTATPDPGILVEGQRAKSRPIPMSDWYVAETPHVLVYAKANDKRLVRIAHNLEKLHFLLSMLFNRVDEVDETAKLRVTLIGDSTDFDRLVLHNVRWQTGPYPRIFPKMLYYDPREDGAVLATSYTDRKIFLQQPKGVPSRSDIDPRDEPSENLSVQSSLEPLAPGTIDLNGVIIGEKSLPMTAEGRLYAGFAQHYLLTYFPAAYPRWYLDGFGEIFSTVQADVDGIIEYGHQPVGFRDIYERYGSYPLPKLLDGTYLIESSQRPRWTPYRAWQLAHFMFFSEEMETPFHNYLKAVARGAPPQEAAAALGDMEALRKQLLGYHGRKAPYERMVYPVDRAIAPLVRQLNRSEAAYVAGKLELGARMEIPPPRPPAPMPRPPAA